MKLRLKIFIEAKDEIMDVSIIVSLRCDAKMSKAIGFIHI